MINSLYPQFQRWSAGGSVYIISDTHFDDVDCKLMNPNWISPAEHMEKLKKQIHKGDTLIHLGDVGTAAYLDELKCYKVLITGNHDVLSKVASHFNEVYDGPLFIADRILLSHEPIKGLETFCLNIHGHVHNGCIVTYYNTGSELRVSHLNLASDVAHFLPCNLKSIIKQGYLSKIQNYHRLTIQNATENSLKEKENERP